MQKLRRHMATELRMRKPMILLNKPNADAGVNDQGVAQDAEVPVAQDAEIPVEGDEVEAIEVIGVQAYAMMQAALEGLKEVVGE